jgi:hypothetical protein
MSAPIAVSTMADAYDFTCRIIHIKSFVLAVVPVGMWAKASISPLFELAREAGEAQPVGEADCPHIHRPSAA